MIATASPTYLECPSDTATGQEPKIIKTGPPKDQLPAGSRVEFILGTITGSGTVEGVLLDPERNFITYTIKYDELSSNHNYPCINIPDYCITDFKPPRTSNMVLYAKRELELLGLFNDPDDNFNIELGNSMLSIVKAFSEQGYSGGMAGECVRLVEKLLRFQPLTPLTGEDDEWLDVSEYSGNQYMCQNKRCSTVFKDQTGAYNIDGIIWEDLDGSRSINFESRTAVEFPYTPHSRVVLRKQ
jgi:hypothetical protein